MGRNDPGYRSRRSSPSSWCSAPLVFVHEFGHFIVAKMLGIGVPVFSLGFGPRLFGLRAGRPIIASRPSRWAVTCGWPGTRRTRTVTGAARRVPLATQVAALSGLCGRRDLQHHSGRHGLLVAVRRVTARKRSPTRTSMPAVRSVVRGLARPTRPGLQKRGDVMIEIGGRDVAGLRDLRSMPTTWRSCSRPTDDQDGRRSSATGERMTDACMIEVEAGREARPRLSIRGGGSSWGGDETPVIAQVKPGRAGRGSGRLAGRRPCGRRGRATADRRDRQFRSLIEANPGARGTDCSRSSAGEASWSHWSFPTTTGSEEGKGSGRAPRAAVGHTGISAWSRPHGEARGESTSPTR